jgi:predicted XRE-type DNA-binding protein
MLGYHKCIPTITMRLHNIPKSSVRNQSVNSRSVSRADEVLPKQSIVRDIGKAIASRNLTQRAVGDLLGVSQPKISLLLRGQFNAYSLAQLNEYLRILKAQPISSRQPMGRKSIKTQIPRWTKTAVATRNIPQPLGSSSAPATLYWVAPVFGSQDTLALRREIEQLRRENEILRHQTDRFDEITKLFAP